MLQLLLLQAWDNLSKLHACVPNKTEAATLLTLSLLLAKAPRVFLGQWGEQVQVSGLAACCACRGVPAILLVQRLRDCCLSE